MPLFVNDDPCVFLSVHWADWVGAFGRRRYAAVARSLGLSVEILVEYVAEQPPRAVGVARLLCKLANYSRLCQYAATDRPSGYAPLQNSAPKRDRIFARHTSVWYCFHVLS